MKSIIFIFFLFTGTLYAESIFFFPLLSIIEIHQKETHIDGPTCSMYPSCSHFSKQAIKEHGWMGFLFTIDRLFYKENGNLSKKYLLAPDHLTDEMRYYDPPEENLPIFKEKKPSFLTDELFSHT